MQALYVITDMQELSRKGTYMKKSEKYIILTCIAVIAVIIAGGVIYKNINKPTKGVCVEQGRMVNGSGPFTSEEVHSAMEALKVLFEDKYAGCHMTDMWYSETGGTNYKTDTDSRITLHGNVTTGSVSIGRMQKNTSYSDWQWVFQKNAVSGEWEYLSDGYGV